jgi:hypothetical protein
MSFVLIASWNTFSVSAMAGIAEQVAGIRFIQTMKRDFADE